MNLNQLTDNVKSIINNIKDNGFFKKENDFIDYKKELNHYGQTDDIEIFFRNFAKDIISFTNNKGGIILIGFDENRDTGEIEEIGLEEKDLKILEKIDLSKVNQKLNSITKCSFGLDLQQFQIGSRKFYYFIIERSNDIIIPLSDYKDYKLKKGEIIHRIAGMNETANENSQKINRFLQIKANEKNKEFMEIWSKLLPEIFDINPKEILMINPKTNMIYGYNQKDKNLIGSEIDIDKSEKAPFNVIFNAISAGEIGKISDTEGKPIYKIVGEMISHRIKTRDSISLSTLQGEVMKKSKYNFTNPQIKQVFKYLGWTNKDNFEINNPEDHLLNEIANGFMWIENLDKIKGSKKIVFSAKAIEPILEIINDNTKHISIFGKKLNAKK